MQDVAQLVVPNLEEIIAILVEAEGATDIPIRDEKGGLIRDETGNIIFSEG